MKKSLILLPLAAVLLSLTGCKKDNEKSGPSGETVTLSATLGGGEKTEIYNETKMRWSEGDAVAINKGYYTAKFNLGHETATFENVTSAETYEAYYPASLYHEENGKYVLPPTQYYNVANGNILSDINPMYAVTTTKILQFHNICALVKLEVTGKGTVKKIVVSSDNNLCGTFTVEGNSGKYHAVISSSEGGKTLTLDCTGVGTGVALNATTPTTFYIALPQGELGNLTFKCSGDAGVWTSQPIATANLIAGKLYTKKLENVEMKPFSVSATTAVEFAPGNLWYDGSAFHFETNQWDFANSWDPSYVGRFKWSAMPEAVDNDYDGYYGNLFCNDNFTVDGDTDWRTLSQAEWDYLLNTRTNATTLRALVTLTDENVYGLVILPDGSDATASGVTTAALVSSSGAVFLPAAGYRRGPNVYDVGSHGYYWSSTSFRRPDPHAGCMYFYSDNVYIGDDYMYKSYAVRLVR